MTSSTISQDKKDEIIEDLNPHFQKMIRCFYCVDKNYMGDKADRSADYVNTINYIKRSLTRFAAEYKDGLLVIISYTNASEFELETMTDEMLEILHKHLPRATIGISNPGLLSDIGNSISQSFIAANSRSFDEDGVSHFDALGISRLLLAFKGSPILDGFYHDVTDPILSYDAKYNGQFFETMAAFIENDMDYKQTAQELFLHENTIRYRINKIKELIPYGESEMDFYITIAVVWKLHALISPQSAD